MGRREDLLRREAEGWERINATLVGLSDEQLERPGYTTEGWSIKDLLWHIAAWADDTTRVLREMAEGIWDGEDPSTQPGWTDRVNDGLFERSRTLDLEEVRRSWSAARDRMLETFGALGAPPEEAHEWFDESGPAHYGEHQASLQEWVERLRAEG